MPNGKLQIDVLSFLFNQILSGSKILIGVKISSLESDGKWKKLADCYIARSGDDKYRAVKNISDAFDFNDMSDAVRKLGVISEAVIKYSSTYNKTPCTEFHSLSHDDLFQSIDNFINLVCH